MSEDRFKPLKEELSNFQDQVKRVIEDTFSGNAVPLDIYETEDSVVVVSGAILGLDPSTLDISITEGHQLSISGVTSSPDDIAEPQFIRQERKFGSFSRTVNIPVAVMAEDAKASYKNNVLKITIPKVTQEGPKVVKVTPVD